MMTTPSIEVLITFISIQLNKMIGFHTDTTGTYASYFVSTNNAVMNASTLHNPL